MHDVHLHLASSERTIHLRFIKLTWMFYRHLYASKAFDAAPITSCLTLSAFCSCILLCFYPHTCAFCLCQRNRKLEMQTFIVFVQFQVNYINMSIAWTVVMLFAMSLLYFALFFWLYRLHGVWVDRLSCCNVWVCFEIDENWLSVMITGKSGGGA